MFKIKKTCSENSARLGELKTAHGKIQTPFFMPVATKASPKHIGFQELKEMGFECFISNAYLLSLKPGLEVIKKASGLHEFIGWNKSIFTDSGGFQMLNDNFLLSVSSGGVKFKNPFNHEKEFITPEHIAEIQATLNSDIAMLLDHVPKYGSSKKELEESVKNTTSWAKRFQRVHENKKQLVFCISQGGTNARLREQSTLELLGLDFDGFALGGLCIGETKKEMGEIIELSKKLIPEKKPVYLMGVGSPKDLINAVEKGIDVFDSCFPTRTARHGLAFARKKNINLENAGFKKDFRPLDEKCKCFVCKSHSKAFLHHLIKAKEETGLRLLSYHNLFFVAELMKDIRTAIKEDSFKELKKEFA